MTLIMEFITFLFMALFSFQVAQANVWNEVCQKNQLFPHWKAVNGQCLPSCGHAKTIYCNQQKDKCSGLQVALGRDYCENTGGRKAHDLDSYQAAPCCLLRVNANSPNHNDSGEMTSDGANSSSGSSNLTKLSDNEVLRYDYYACGDKLLGDAPKAYLPFVKNSQWIPDDPEYRPVPAKCGPFKGHSDASCEVGKYLFPVGHDEFDYRTFRWRCHVAQKGTIRGFPAHSKVSQVVCETKVDSEFMEYPGPMTTYNDPNLTPQAQPFMCGATKCWWKYRGKIIESD